MQQNQSPDHDEQMSKEDQGDSGTVISRRTGIAIAIWVFILAGGLMAYVSAFYVNEHSVRVNFFVGSLFSIAAVIVVVIQAVIYDRQAKALDAQLKISERLATTALRQFEITDRPWLAVDIELISPLTFDEQGGYLTFRIFAKNVGRSLAINATVNTKIVIPIFSGELSGQVIAEQLRVCQTVDSRFMSYAVFPEQTFVSDRGFRLGQQELEQSRIMNTDAVEIYLVGCVDYQFSGHEAHHQTRFVYQVQRAEAADPGHLLLVRIGQDVPMDRLVLQKLYVGRGDYAD